MLKRCDASGATDEEREGGRLLLLHGLRFPLQFLHDRCQCFWVDAALTKRDTSIEAQRSKERGR